MIAVLALVVYGSAIGAYWRFATGGGIALSAAVGFIGAAVLSVCVGLLYGVWLL